MIKVKKRKILLLPGDGIGPEVIGEVKKIINWFDQNEPITGYGKMILGESFVLTSDKTRGTKLIKEGLMFIPDFRVCK